MRDTHVSFNTLARGDSLRVRIHICHMSYDGELVLPKTTINGLTVSEEKHCICCNSDTTNPSRNESTTGGKQTNFSYETSIKFKHLSILLQNCIDFNKTDVEIVNKTVMRRLRPNYD